MAKKNLKLFIPGAIALVLGIAAFCMMFLNAVTYEGPLNSGFSFTGMKLAFGGEIEVVSGVSVDALEFNIMTTLAFFLPLIGGVLALIFKNGLITKIITTACFVVGAVFLFSTTGFTAISLGGQDAKDALLLIFDEKLAAGPIVAGVLSIIGAVVCFFKGTIAKMLG